MNLKSRFKKNICSISIAFFKGFIRNVINLYLPRSNCFSLVTCFHIRFLHDYLLNGYRIPSQGENVSINQWHINYRCIFYVGYISPVKVIILNYLVILSRTICLAIILNIYYTVLMLYILFNLPRSGNSNHGRFSYIVIYLYIKINY